MTHAPLTPGMCRHLRRVAAGGSVPRATLERLVRQGAVFIISFKHSTETVPCLTDFGRAELRRAAAK